MMRDRIRFVLVVPILVAALFLGCSRQPISRSASRSDATTPNRKLRYEGRLEPVSGVISIGALGERLKSLDVREGDVVTKEQRLGELASYQARVAEVEAIENQLKVAGMRWKHEQEVAKARLSQANAAVGQSLAKKEEVELLGMTLALLSRQANRAEGTYSTLLNLQAEDESLATDRELERYELLKDSASIDHAQANERYALGIRTAQEVVKVAEADVAAAQAVLKQIEDSNPETKLKDQLKIARISRDLVDLRAPIDGQIMKILARPGEVLAGPILQIANLNQMVCIAEVLVDDIHRVQTGDRARLTSPAFSGGFADKGIGGTVEFIGSLVVPAGMQGNVLGARDRTMVEVRILIDSTDAQQAAKFVGLQVNVEF